MQMEGKSFLSLLDFSLEDLSKLLDLSARVKRERMDGRRNQRLSGYSLAMIFEKQSTRTRSAFETAFGEEGGHPVFLSSQDIHLGKKESIEDSARVFGGMFDCIAFRGFAQKTVEILSQYSGIPVINALTDDSHPTQVMADLLTMQEEFGKLAGLKLCFVGDGTNNVARSLIAGCALFGIDMSIVSPKEFQPPMHYIDESAAVRNKTRSNLTISDSLKSSLDGAHAVYTDVWVSMGQEDQSGLREKILAPYCVTEEAMKMTGRKESIFLHCLPAIKEKEVSYSVIEGPQSRVWIEAENRKHTIKAILLAVLGLS